VYFEELADHDIIICDEISDEIIDDYIVASLFPTCALRFGGINLT